MWSWKYIAAIVLMVLWPRDDKPSPDVSRLLKTSIPHDFDRVQIFANSLQRITSVAVSACSEVYQHYGDVYRLDDPIYPIGQSREWVTGKLPPLALDESAIIDRASNSDVDIRALCQRIEFFHRYPSPGIVEAAVNGTLDTYSTPWLQLLENMLDSPRERPFKTSSGALELDSRFAFPFERLNRVFNESEWVADSLVGGAMEEFRDNMNTLTSIYTAMGNAEDTFVKELEGETSAAKRQMILSRIIEGSVQLGPGEWHIPRWEEKLRGELEALGNLIEKGRRISRSMFSWAVGIELINVAMQAHAKGYDSKLRCATVTPEQLRRILGYMSLTWFNQGRNFPVHLWYFMFMDVQMDHVNHAQGGYWEVTHWIKGCLYS